MKKIFYLPIFLMLLSCEDEVDIDLPAGDTKICAEILIEGGQPIYAFSSISAPIKGNSIPFFDGENVIKITENDSNSESLTYYGALERIPSTSFYTYRSDMQATAGSRYTVEISRAGFPTAEASGTCPPPPQISGFSIDTAERSFVFQLQDHPTQGNFYRMELWSSATAVSVYHYVKDDIFETIYQGGEVLDEQLSGGTISLWHDSGWNGKSKEFKVYYLPPTKNDTLLIVISQISQDYYLYEHSRHTQLITGSLQPEHSNLHGNIKNGFGAVLFSNSMRILQEI